MEVKKWNPLTKDEFESLFRQVRENRGEGQKLLEKIVKNEDFLFDKLFYHACTRRFVEPQDTLKAMQIFEELSSQKHKLSAYRLLQLYTFSIDVALNHSFFREEMFSRNPEADFNETNRVFDEMVYQAFRILNEYDAKLLAEEIAFQSNRFIGDNRYLMHEISKILERKPRFRSEQEIALSDLENDLGRYIDVISQSDSDFFLNAQVKEKFATSALWFMLSDYLFKKAGNKTYRFNDTLAGLFLENIFTEKENGLLQFKDKNLENVLKLKVRGMSEMIRFFDRLNKYSPTGVHTYSLAISNVYILKEMTSGQDRDINSYKTVSSIPELKVLRNDETYEEENYPEM